MAEDIRAVLGLPYDCSGFTDGNSRTVYPVTMKKFPSFIENVRFINPKALWNNMIFDEGIAAVTYVMKESFRDDDVDDVMENINAGNFVEIIDTILTINGIPTQKDEDKEGKNGTEV
ncbi:hypothetical protein [Paenibacillus sp. MMO-177]|uniref:hypothetical protein n=1 Tax=Paenibacillus sp. MMO-177 TaxID=3081289 RepID=UPI00301921FC